MLPRCEKTQAFFSYAFLFSSRSTNSVNQTLLCFFPLSLSPALASTPRQELEFWNLANVSSAPDSAMYEQGDVRKVT